MTSREDFDEPIEIDEEMLSPGKDLTPAPPPVAPYKQWSDPMPARLTPQWVRGQLPEAVWKANRTAINPESIVFMYSLREKGVSQRGVMARMGMNQANWNRWLQKAREGEPLYALWYQCMCAAQANMEEELLDNVRDKAVDDWKAATWLLGKIQPEDYNDKATGNTTINVHGDVNSKQTTVNSLSNDEIAGILGVFDEIDIGHKALAVEAEVVEDE